MFWGKNEKEEVAFFFSLISNARRNTQSAIFSIIVSLEFVAAVFSYFANSIIIIFFFLGGGGSIKKYGYFLKGFTSRYCSKVI